jgi:hypothetical protein
MGRLAHGARSWWNERQHGAGVGEYASDGTIECLAEAASVLARSSSFPAGRRVEVSHAMDEEYRMDEEEEDVMGLLFTASTSNDDRTPPSGLGKGKGKSRAAPVDSVVDSPESVGASPSTRVQRKR